MFRKEEKEKQWMRKERRGRGNEKGIGGKIKGTERKQGRVRKRSKKSEEQERG